MNEENCANFVTFVTPSVLSDEPPTIARNTKYIIFVAVAVGLLIWMVWIFRNCFRAEVSQTTHCLRKIQYASANTLL